MYSALSLVPQNTSTMSQLSSSRMVRRSSILRSRATGKTYCVIWSVGVFSSPTSMMTAFFCTRSARRFTSEESVAEKSSVWRSSGIST